MAVVALAAALYVGYLTVSATQTVREGVDPYLRFAKLSESYLKVVRATYTTGVILTLSLDVQNTFSEPIYYRAPLIAYISYQDSDGNTHLLRVVLNNESTLPYFQPGVIVRLSGSAPFSPSYTVLGAYLSVNGVPIHFTPESIGVTQEPDAYCTSCSSCQSLIDTWKSQKNNAWIALSDTMVIDKDPCIELLGDGNGLIFDCMGFPLDGNGSNVFLFVNGSNYTVRGCSSVSGFSRAVDVASSSSVEIRTLVTPDAPDVVYVEDPVNPSSYDIILVDVGDADRKIYQYHPSAVSVYSAFLPLALWIYNYTGPVTIDANWSDLQKVHPPILVTNSSDVTISRFRLTSSYPYSVVLYNSSGVALQDANMNFSGLRGIYAYNSTIELNSVDVTSSATEDMNLVLTDANLGDLNIHS